MAEEEKQRKAPVGEKISEEEGEEEERRGDRERYII